MEDLASEFREDFLEAVKELEDFSSSDGALREAMREVRQKIAAKAYNCAPNFWADLRESLHAVERQRDESTAKSKAQQVLKQVARLEVRFWAKESIGMLREMDAEFRMERMRDWVLTFDGSEGGDQSSGPAVLYQVLSDVSLQKDLEPQQRDSLLTAVRENLHKFPVAQRALLERMCSLQAGMTQVPSLSDWRRRNQPSGPEQAVAGGVHLSFVPMQPRPSLAAQAQAAAAPAAAAPPAPPAESPAAAVAAPAEGAGVAEPLLLTWGLDAAALAAQEAAAEEVEQEPFDLASVDPAVLERGKRAVLAALEANGGECQRQHVRTLLKQAGLERMPIAALGDSVFCSPTETFLRRPGTPVPAAAPASGGSPLPEELRGQIVEAVRSAGGRLPVAKLVEALQWHKGSIRHAMHGPLKKALAQVQELFFEPKKVMNLATARLYLAALAPEEEEPAPQPEEAAPVPAVPYTADPFMELLATIRSWLEQEEGVLNQEAVLPLVRALGFKLRPVIAALAKDVYWCHPEAECEILLRTNVGAVQHPRPLPKVYLHEAVHQKLMQNIRQMGAKAKLDKLAGQMGWNAKSELKKAYGTLRVVLSGLREVFFDPSKLYFKKNLEGLVEWPVNREGRLGPHQAEEPLQHWTPAVDDARAQSDPGWLAVKRQVLGALMRGGGACEVEVLRPLLQPLEGVELESLLQPGSPHDLSELLFWPKDLVYCRRPEAIVPEMAVEGVSREARLALADVVRRQGPLSVEELKGALEAGGVGEAEALLASLAQVPELLYAPNAILLRPVAERTAILSREAAESEGQEAGAARAAEPLAIADAAKSPEEAPAEAAPQFFSFSEFTPQASPEGEEPPEKAKPESLEDSQRPAKRARRADGGSAALPAPNWADEAPPWAIPGAAVALREGGAVGVVLKVRGSVCTVKLKSGGEQELSTPALLPESPSVGTAVRVVAGERAGCQGQLVGLAGASGVVQVAGLSYETLPMSHLVALAS